MEHVKAFAPKGQSRIDRTCAKAVTYGFHAHFSIRDRVPEMKQLSTFLLLAMLSASSLLAAEDPLSAGANAAFLAASAGKPGTIVRPSGLQYRVLRSGTGKRPGTNDIVRLAYGMRLINGTLVDSTTPALPATLAMSTVNLAGLAEALSLMHAGDRWQLTVPANLAYGARGAMNGAVPPDQSLLLDVTLVSASAPQPGQVVGENPFSVWSNGRETGAAFTIRP
jgi:FKBP-type peptidyl-prolyl cis-trans isomerase